jgi:prevent-host-death family protein
MKENKMARTKKLKETREKYRARPETHAKEAKSNRDTKKQRAISTTEIRRNLNRVIQQVSNRREHAIIERGGSPVAVLLSVTEYEQLLKYKRLAAFDRLTREIGEAVEQGGLTEQELMADLEQTKRQVVKETYAGVA